MKDRSKLILKYARPHWLKFTILFASIIITTFTGVIYPYIFGRLVDEVFYRKNMSVFLNIVIIYGVVYLFNQAMHFVLNMSWASLMTEFLFDIREAIFKKVLTRKGEELSGIYSGDVIARMDSDTDQFMNFIHWNVFYTIGGILNLVMCIGFIIYINLWLALLTVILIPVLVYISRHFGDKAKKYYKMIAGQNGLMSSWLFEVLKGMQDIKLLGATKTVLSDYTGKTIKIMRYQIKSGKVEVYSERVNSGLTLFGQMVLYILSAVFIIKGQMTVGGFTACISYFGSCAAIFNNLNNKIISISNNMVSIERVQDTLDTQSENYNQSKPDIKIKEGSITYSDIWFSYNNEKEVLKGISLKINPGEIVSLVGSSGTGKTTLANLVYKLYEANSGEIYIDDININDFNLHNLRSQVGIVHQESIFFDGTIRYNIAFNNDKNNDKEIWEALKMASLYEFVMSLPNGLDTVLGPEGVSFSGGQKQRLAIARIFIKNPKILIFDEATSSLDSESEAVIRSSWNALCEGRTIIIIAHRLSTIISSDRVAVIKDGEIAGYDSHENLLQTCGAYVDLFKEQYSKSEVNPVA